MISTSTLALPNFAEPFTIEADASGEGIGAVLTQHGKPIAYMSRALGVSKLFRSTFAKEILVVVVAIQTWRMYHLGCKIFIKIDQYRLKYLMDQQITTSDCKNGLPNYSAMIMK